MNAKRIIAAGAALAAGALGIGAVAQELMQGAHSEEAGAERFALSGAKHDDGDYDFYFRNGAHISGDCDGYDSWPGGVTYIYEYRRVDIQKWSERLSAAGIAHATHKTPNWFRYCWVRFDTKLLNGVGWEGEGKNLDYNDEADILANGRQIRVKDVWSLHYARAREGFNSSFAADSVQNLVQRTSEAQKWRDTPAILLIFLGQDKDEHAKTAEALKGAGVSVIASFSAGTAPYIIMDASNISWFAYYQ